MLSRTRSCFKCLLAIIPFTISLAGCFGDGDSPSGASGTPLTSSSPFTGTFVDSQVDGLHFIKSDGSEGFTVEGNFPYSEGESINFRVGTIDLGTLAARKLITPVELAVAMGGVEDPTVPPAVNILVFLQSIDADENPQNGITITNETRQLAEGFTLDFDATEGDFNTAVTSVIETITATLGKPGGNAVVSVPDALDHFYQTYVVLGGSDTVSWAFTGRPPFPSLGPPAGLANGNFELPTFVSPFSPQGCAGTLPAGNWTCSGAGTSHIISDRETFGQYPNSLGIAGAPGSHPDSATSDFQTLIQFGDAAISQAVTLFTGDTIDVTAHAMNWVIPISGFVGLENNTGSLVVDFWGGPGGTGDPLGSQPVVVAGLPPKDGTLGDADWTAFNTGALVAPNGTQSATVSLTHTDVAPAGGYLVWDDVIVNITEAPVPDAFFLVWNDDFDGPEGSLPDPQNWYIETGYGPNGDGWGNQEWQLYTTDPANVSITENDPTDPLGANRGYLNITARCSEALPEDCGVRDDTVTSGKVSTQMSEDPFTFRYGRVVARIKLPKDKGSWPAFWMLGENFPPWPFSGEIDIIEGSNLVSGDKPGIQNLFWCNLPNQENLSFCPPANAPFEFVPLASGDVFQEFEIEWNPREIIWRVDGVQTYIIDTTPQNLEEFRKKFYLILNVAMGGNLGSNRAPPAADTVFPQTMLVDYVEVYQGITLDQAGALQGGGFEPPDANAGGGGCPGNSVVGGSSWRCINFPFIRTDANGPVSHDIGGSQSLEMSGFDGIVENTIDVVGGDIVDLTAWLMNWDDKPFENLGVIIVSFWDQPDGRRGAEDGNGGQRVGGEVTNLLWPGSFLDDPNFVLEGNALTLPEQDGNEIEDWTKFTRSYLAPANAKSMNVFFLHQWIDGTPNAGAFYVDDVSAIRR